MEKIKLLWFGDSPVCTTGFGRVSQGILEKLYQTDKYTISNLGINHPMGDPHRYEGMFKIYPARAKNHIYGFNRVQEVVDKVKPDVIVINNDLWIVQQYLKSMPEKNKVIVYAPIDALPIHHSWMDVINKTNARLVTYTEFGKKAILDMSPDCSIDVIGHGVDIDEFYPMDDARNFISVPKDAFIIQNVNRNQPRKRLDLWLQACGEFINRYPKDNICVYYHGTLNDLGWDLISLSNRYGINNKLLVTDQNNLTPAGGVSLDILCKIYNCADVQVMTSMGEGFGLSPFESAACGVPQIVPDSSATKELWEGSAPLIKIDHYDVLTGGINTEGAVIDIDNLVNILDNLYNNRDKLETYARLAYDLSQEERFTWEYVANEFDRIIQDVLSSDKWFNSSFE